MEFQDFKNMFMASDKENISLELKQSDKVSELDDIIKIIVGIANRNGGHLVIGVKDDGEPEGELIFDKYKTDTKSGVDVVKGKISDICLYSASIYLTVAPG